MEICGKELRIDGKLIRIGFIDGEGYQVSSRIRRRRSPSCEVCEPELTFLRFIPRLSDNPAKLNYPMEPDNMAALPISTFDEWMTKQIDFKVRNKVRKAAKNGVEVREAVFDDAYVRGIHAIYNECPVRQGKPFWHYGKDLEAVRKMNATFMDRSIFIGAFFEGSLIGFVKLVFDENKNQAGLMQIVSMVGHQDKAPTNALIAQAVKSCAERKFRTCGTRTFVRKKTGRRFG